MDELKKKIQSLEIGIENSHREIEYHEKQIELHRDNYNDLTRQWTEATVHKQISIVYEDLKIILELLKIKDKDVHLEFFEYLRCVFIEHDQIELAENYVEHIINQLKSEIGREYEDKKED